jgi:predicted phage terminase large subunit-like protein
MIGRLSLSDDISIDQVRTACKNSLHFLCTKILGYNDWDKVHDDVEEFVNRKSIRKLLLIPRGHLKTAIVTKGFAIQSLLKNPDVRILIANQVWDKSREMLYEIKQLLTEKTDLPKLFGDFISERWREDDIVIRQRRKALAAPTIGTSGVEAELTSSHYDIIILDDLQGEKNFQTPEQREKVKRYYRSMIDLIEPGGLIIVIGTRWHLDDVYQYIIDNESEYYDISVRKVIEDNKIIFPKKFQKKFNPQTKAWDSVPYHCTDYIDYLKKRPSEEFSSQYMNDPIDSQNQIFKKEYFKYYDRRPERLFVSMTIDPAISEKQSADYFAINVAGMDENYKIYVLDTLKGHWKVAESIDNIFSMYQKWHPSVVGLETIAYQKALKSWLEEKMRERGVYFPITELRRNTNESKEFRIKALEPFYRDGLVYHAPWMKSLETELLQFPKGKHDDEIDSLASQLDLLVPGDSQASEGTPPGCWEAALHEAKKHNQPYRGFFNE